MKRSLMALVAALLAAPAMADVRGFVQVRQAQRGQPLDLCLPEACSAMVQELSGELLVTQRLNDRTAVSVRTEATYDNAVSKEQIALREGFVDWRPASNLDLRLGRQVLTWGASDYLYVNDIFPKNYDVFFTGGGFDRMKEAVDAARLNWHTAAAEMETVVSRAKADGLPEPARLTATTMLASAVAADDADDEADAAIKVSTHATGWDLAAYAASFRSREPRHFMDASGLRLDRPRLAHLGLSLTGNAAAGVVWLEGGIRHAGTIRENVVHRHFLGSSAKLIVGYSREVGQDITASAQLQVEAPTAYARYVATLAPGVRPVSRVGAVLHLRLQGGWINQTLRAGAQLFAGSERDTHFNPFARWSPADGWTLEAGANLFNGRPEARYGAFKDDSNVYALARFSF